MHSVHAAHIGGFFSCLFSSLRFPFPSSPPGPRVPAVLRITCAAATATAASEEQSHGRGPPPRSPTLLHLMLRPPLNNSKLAERFLNSPQLSLNTFPLLSSCLSPSPLCPADHEWMDKFLPQIKQALGYPLPGMESPPEETPLCHLDSLLYLAFQHRASPRSRMAHYVRVGHSRLWFLGEYVLDLALAELFLQMFPSDRPAAIRRRAFGLTNKKTLPKWIKGASLHRPMFPNNTIRSLNSDDRQHAFKRVFGALIAVAYLTLGMKEVYRILFEVFGLDPHAKSWKPKASIPNIDFVSPKFKKRLKWQDIILDKLPPDSLFAKPRLLQACMPPGMHCFRGNVWAAASLPSVLQELGYPRPTAEEDPDVTLMRNMELELGLQLCFMHPLLYNQAHPRFCNERLEYLGSKVQDVVMSERLLMQNLDGPGDWLGEKHRKLLFNRLCGKYLREKGLHQHMLIAEEKKIIFEKNRHMRICSTTAVQKALHGLAYMVYGKSDVRRLMFQVFNFERM